MYAIYALVDPRDYTVHYVGQTSDVYHRFTQHVNGAGSSFIKNAWILELRALNRMIIMETLEEVETHQEAIEREAYWIKHFEMLREPLANATHRASLKRVKKDQLKAARNAAVQVLATIETKPVTEPVHQESVSHHLKEASSALANALSSDDRGKPVERFPTVLEKLSNSFQPGKDDLTLSGMQGELFLAYYGSEDSPSRGSVEESLKQVRNDKGQGLGKRYYKHANWLLEQRGLKKVKRA